MRQHGPPPSTARRGNQEFFVYPNGGRVELTDGIVSDIRGPLPPPPAPPEIPAAADKTPPTAPTKKFLPTNRATETAPRRPSGSPSGAKTKSAPAVLTEPIEKADAPWGQSSSLRGKRSAPPTLAETIFGLLLRLGITIAALKLAFKYWEMDALWRGVFAIAGIDFAVHAVFAFLGPVTDGFTTMPAVENGIPGLVLIYTINRYCFNTRLMNAILTAIAVKVFAGFLYVFAGIALLDVAFG